MHSNQLKYMLIGGAALLVTLVAVVGVSVVTALETALIAVPVMMLMTMGRNGHGGCGGHDTQTSHRRDDVPAPVPVETKTRR